MGQRKSNQSGNQSGNHFVDLIAKLFSTIEGKSGEEAQEIFNKQFKKKLLKTSQRETKNISIIGEKSIKNKNLMGRTLFLAFYERKNEGKDIENYLQVNKDFFVFT